MKIIKGLLFIAALILASCGGEGEEGSESLSIETKDVKGTIEVKDHKKVITGELHKDGQVYEQPIVRYPNDTEIAIFPDKDNIDEVIAYIESRADGSFETNEIIEKGENYVFYKQTLKAFNENEEDEVGYMAIVVVENPNGGYYHLKTAGDTPFTPIPDEADAKSLLEQALTFKAK